MKAITTKFHGPTNFRGSRVSATDSDGNRVFVDYSQTANSEAAHAEAAIALVKKMNWGPCTLIAGATKTGYVFVFDVGSSRYEI
jgi:hypothetical protein